MNRLLLFSISIFTAVTCYAQEVELCTSLSISSERRFQNATGFGLQYQQGVSRKFKVGFGLQYITRNAVFDDIPFIDSDPRVLVADKIHSNAKRFSIRVNVQKVLGNNEYLLFSVGPEVSYNHLWGIDEVEEKARQATEWVHFSNKNSLTTSFGIGLISKLEIKHILIPQLSVCLTVRPEMVGDMIFPKGGTRVFSGILGFTEFQFGLKYRFNKAT